MLREKLFACQMLSSVGECTHRVINVYLFVCDEIVEFLQVNKHPELPIGVPLQENWTHVFAELERCDNPVVLH